MFLVKHRGLFKNLCFRNDHYYYFEPSKNLQKDWTTAGCCVEFFCLTDSTLPRMSYNVNRAERVPLYHACMHNSHNYRNSNSFFLFLISCQRVFKWYLHLMWTRSTQYKKNKVDKIYTEPVAQGPLLITQTHYNTSFNSLHTTSNMCTQTKKAHTHTHTHTDIHTLTHTHTHTHTQTYTHSHTHTHTHTLRGNV